MCGSLEASSAIKVPSWGRVGGGPLDGAHEPISRRCCRWASAPRMEWLLLERPHFLADSDPALSGVRRSYAATQVGVGIGRRSSVVRLMAR